MSSDVVPAAAPSHEQKAQLLLEMANAVEESNARKRHYQYQHQQHHRVDAFAMDQLINDLESASAAVCGAKPAMYATDATIEPTKNASASAVNGDSAATSAMTVSLESKTSVLSEEQRNTPNHQSTDDSMRKYVERQRRQPTPRQHPQQSPKMQQQHPQHSRPRPRPRRTSAAPVPVDPYQVQLLYTAMVSYRENTDLRYQLLELRHLDLRQSFVEMETRYRLLEHQQEAWKQSCQVLQQLPPKQVVTTEEAGDHDEDNGSATSSHLDSGSPPSPTNKKSRMKSTTINTTSNALQTHTVPHLQQEMRSLSSQRNQLLQANLELRKQLKQIQILQTQQQEEFGQEGLINSCQRCHPELFAVKQEREVDRVMEHIVENVPSVSRSRNIVSGNQRNKNRHLVRKEGKERASMADEAYRPSVNDSFSHSMEVEDESEDEHQHEDNMSLTGMHLGGTSNHSNGCHDSYSGAGGGGAPPTRQQSIVWPPPTTSSHSPHRGSHGHGNIVSPTSGRKAELTSATTPTLKSFLPMQQPGGSKDSHDIDVSPRRENNNEREFDMHAMSAKDISLVTQLRGNTEGEMSRSQPPQEQGMGCFGMLDEFGRSMSNRRLQEHDTGESLTPSTREPSKTAGNTGMKSLFRRKPSAHQQQNGQHHHHKAPPTHKLPPETAKQSQTTQRYSVGHDGTIEFQIIGHTAGDRHSLPGSQPSRMMINSRHLELSATPEKASPSPRQTRPKLQVNHPGGSIMKIGAGAGNRRPSPGKMRRPASHVTKAPTPPCTARSNVTGRNVSNAHPVASNGHRGQPTSAKQMARSPQKHQQRVNGAPVHHQSQGRQHQQHQHTPRGQGHQEKAEASSRAQTYFQRIKKTLQQEM